MKKSNSLSHLDSTGAIRMVDVSGKRKSKRKAVAVGKILVSEEVIEAVRDDKIAKGNVLNTAKLAAIQAAKKTHDLIPLCHPLRIGWIGVEFELKKSSIKVECSVSGLESTGFEMEALTGVSIALLTIYDMTKAMDKSMELTGIHLLMKTGGKSGEYRWQK